MNRLLTLAGIAIGAFFFGRITKSETKAQEISPADEIVLPYDSMSWEEKFECEREYCNSLFFGLHWFYVNRPKEFAEFMQTEEFQDINLANEGDWEDFWCTEW